MSLVLTTHDEKFSFLKNFLKNRLRSYPRDKPLMIYGSGGNGKTKIVKEILENPPDVNVVILNNESRFVFVPAMSVSNECAYLLVNNGTQQDFDVAKYLGAYTVEFAKDPAFSVSGQT